MAQSHSCDNDKYRRLRGNAGAGIKAVPLLCFDGMKQMKYDDLIKKKEVIDHVRKQRDTQMEE